MQQACQANRLHQCDLPVNPGCRRRRCLLIVRPWRIGDHRILGKADLLTQAPVPGWELPKSAPEFCRRPCRSHRLYRAERMTRALLGNSRSSTARS